MGIYTVSITKLGLENVVEYLEGSKSWQVIRKLGDGVQLVRPGYRWHWWALRSGRCTSPASFRPVAIDRAGRTLLPEDDMCFAYNDILYLAVASESLAEARDMLGL